MRPFWRCPRFLPTIWSGLLFLGMATLPIPLFAPEAAAGAYHLFFPPEIRPWPHLADESWHLPYGLTTVTLLVLGYLLAFVDFGLRVLRKRNHPESE